MKTTVIYHRADFDGLFCREIARKRFGEKAEYIGWDYGDKLIPAPAEGPIYILDLSPECLEAQFPDGPDLYERLVWIDHHASAIRKFSPDNGFPQLGGCRIDGVAACRLAWQYFFGTEDQPNKQQFIDRAVDEPLAVRLAGEYDIWDKRDPRAELFQHGLRSQKFTELTWRVLLCDDAEAEVAGLLERGKAIQYAQTEQNASIIQAYGFTFHWEGLTFLGCNHARFNSQLFTAGLKPEHEALFGFNYDGTNGMWRVSLYHAPGHEDLDLSLIATKYGGGGHRGACGFRTHTLPFLGHQSKERAPIGDKIKDLPRFSKEDYPKEYECVWSQDNVDGDQWNTGCGHAFILNEETPVKNGFTHCCFCGEPLREALSEETK